MIIVIVKTTRFPITAIMVVASFLGILATVAGCNLKEGSTSANGIVLGTTTDSRDELSRLDSGSLISMESQKNILIRPNDPFFDKQWAFDQMNITDLWDVTKNCREVLVAILDTGVDSDHEDLQGKVVAEVNFTDSPSIDDINGHGTHIAGIICATANNGIGVTGLVPNCKIMNVKVADDYGFCQAANVANGIIWSVDNGAQVINISLEIKNPSLDLGKAVNYAWDRGVLIIAAAGNQGNNSAVYPAYYENCIAVSATRYDNTLAPLSNYGDWVDIAAPGYNIYSTLPGNKYNFRTGTSFAASYVSGLAAILSSIIVDMNGNGMMNDEVRNIIESSCRRMSYANYEYNVIDANEFFRQFIMINP